MSDMVLPNILEDFFNSHCDFEYLLKKDKEYYLNRLHRLDSILINNLAKALVAYYHRQYYVMLDKILKIDDSNWEEYHFYNQDLLDEYFDYVENELQVYTESDLKILIAILDISFLFLKNADDENDFESTLNAFFQFKNKLESNNFTKTHNRNVMLDKNNHSFKKINVVIEVNR